MITPTVPDTVNAVNEVIDFSLIFSSRTSLALGEMPNDEKIKATKTKRDSRVRHGWWKNAAINGARKNSIVYRIRLTMTLNQNTEL